MSPLALGYPLLGRSRHVRAYTTACRIRASFFSASIHFAMKCPAPCSAVLRHRPLVGVDAESYEVVQETPHPLMGSGRPHSFRHPETKPRTGGWRRTVEHFMAKWIVAEKTKAGLRHAMVCPNVREGPRRGCPKQTGSFGSLALLTSHNWRELVRAWFADGTFPPHFMTRGDGKG